MSAGFEVFPRPQTQNLRIRLRQQTQGTGHRRLSVQPSGNLLSRIGMYAGSTWLVMTRPWLRSVSVGEDVSEVPDVVEERTVA